MVYQVLVTIVHGDAIGSFTCAIDGIIRKLGFETQIYAENCGSGFPEGYVLHIDQMPTPQEKDVVIYQMCECSKINACMMQWNCRKIAIYHNTTPAEYFTDFSTEQERRQHQSIAEIAQLRDCFDKVIADSEYNRQDLIRMGYPTEKISVISIILNYADYFKAPDLKTLTKYSDGRTNILFVGRLAPNKKIEDVIRIFAYYKREYDPKARLILVGSQFNEKYKRYLEEYIRLIGVRDVVFPGHIPFTAILAFYATADVFLCMSEHEGFCVPLVESMLFNVPIIAYSSSAIPFTLGGSGLLTETKDPVYVSALMARLIKDKEFRKAVVDGQTERLKAFDADVLIDEFCKELKKSISEVVR